jgi:hypothetical protein
VELDASTSQSTLPSVRDETVEARGHVDRHARLG